MKIVVPDKEIKIDDLSDLLNSNKNDKSEIKILGSGSTKGKGRGKELDSLTKELIAIDGSAKSAPQKVLAEVYGVTQASVSQKSNALTTSGPGGETDLELKETVDRVRNKIENKAVSKLMSTLDLFNPEGLEDQMQVITAASRLASVVEKVSGRNKDKDKPNVQVILYQPRMRDAKDYGEVIEVG